MQKSANTNKVEVNVEFLLTKVSGCISVGEQARFEDRYYIGSTKTVPVASLCFTRVTPSY